jgi:hypothetical protein
MLAPELDGLFLDILNKGLHNLNKMGRAIMPPTISLHENCEFFGHALQFL